MRTPSHTPRSAVECAPKLPVSRNTSARRYACLNSRLSANLFVFTRAGAAREEEALRGRFRCASKEAEQLPERDVHSIAFRARSKMLRQLPSAHTHTQSS